MSGSGCASVPRPRGRVCLFGGARAHIGRKMVLVLVTLTTATVSHLCDHAGYRP
jgi:hypothetical protein